MHRNSIQTITKLAMNSGTSTRSVKRLLAACVMGIALASIALPAIAQPSGGGGEGRGGGGRMGGGGMGGGMRDMMSEPSMNSDQLERYSTMLTLSDDQKQAAGLLHDGYEAEIRQLQDDVRSQMESIRDRARESGDPSVWQELREPMTKARESRKMLDETLTSDLKSLLTEEQAANWPAVERAMRRDQTIRRGLLSGERIDLIKMVDDLKLADEAKLPLTEVLGRYEEDLDRELVKRALATDSAMSQMDILREDPAKAQTVLEEVRGAAVRVRNVNRRYARQISDLLPTDQKKQFDTDFQKASFPDVYRETQATRGMTAAMSFDDLTEEQRTKITTIQEKYVKDVAAMTDRMTKAIEDNEMTMTADRLMGGFGRGGFGGGRGQGGGQGGGGEDETPLAKVRTERRDLDRAANEALREALTEEQIERLPRAAQRLGGGGGGDGAADGGVGRQRGRGNRDGGGGAGAAGGGGGEIAPPTDRGV